MKTTLIPACAAALAFAAFTTPAYADTTPTTANLVHRWSFNGDYEDTGSTGGKTATPVSAASGNVAFNSGNTAICLHAPGSGNNSHQTGYVNLGTDVVPTDTDGATIEIFATPLQARTWSRIFSYGSNGYNIDMCWTENGDVNRDLAMFGGSDFKNTMAPFTLEQQWHISVVFKKDGNGGTVIRYMKRNVETGRIEKSGIVTKSGWTLENVAANAPFWLGGSYFGVTDDAYADYDEVRIWNVALTDGQLGLNAKNGSDTIEFESIPSSLVHRWSFSGTFDDTGSGTHQTAAIYPANSTLVKAGGAALEVTGSSSNWHTGYLNLGQNLLPTDSDGVTIEIFATPKAAYQWARMFTYGYGSSNGQYIEQCWCRGTGRVDLDYVFFPNGSGGTFTWTDTMGTFTLNEMHHLSAVFTKDKNGGTWVRWMRRNTTTGEIEKSQSTRVGNWTLADFGANNPSFLLGGSYNGTADAQADYHEVRIWSAALSDVQLDANAKAGPDIVPAVTESPDSFAAYISTEDQVGRYIDTGLIGRSGTKVEAKFRQTGAPSQWPVLIGVDAADSNRFHPISFHGYYKIDYQYRTTSNSTFYNPGAYGKDLVVTSDFAADGSSVITVKDETGAVLATDERTADPLDTGRNMYLFACNGNTWLADYFYGRCYYVKIWQTDGNGDYQLVRDYVPCVKDGVAGLYDNVSSTIFYQETGSSPFGYELSNPAASATWNGSDTSIATPGNWLCYDENSASINNALPSLSTIVTVDSDSPAPSVDSTVAWSKLYLGNASGTSGAISFSGDAAAQFGELRIGNSGNGSMIVDDNATVTVTGSGYSSLGNTTGSSGTVTQTGGTVTTGTHYEGFNVGRDGTGMYNLSGGTLNVNQALRIGWGGYSSGNKFNMTGGTLNLGNNIFILGDWAQNNEFNMTDGTITCGSGLWYIGGYDSNGGGSTGTGTFTQDGGNITLDNTISIGYRRGTGAYVMNGGTLSEKWWISIGRESGTGTFTQNGGTVTLSGGTSGSNPHCWISLASGSNGTGTYTLNGGTLDIASGITFGENSTGGTGRFEMNGGTSILRTIVKANENVAATLALNGGTLRAKISNASFLDSLGEVTVGNITIDTTDNSYALGVTSGTTLKVTPDTTKPAITLTGSGSLDLSGTTVDLSVKPSAASYVLAKVADGSTATFAAAPGSVTVNGASGTGWKIRFSDDGKTVRVMRVGLSIAIY